MEKILIVHYTQTREAAQIKMISRKLKKKKKMLWQNSSDQYQAFALRVITNIWLVDLGFVPPTEPRIIVSSERLITDIK